MTARILITGSRRWDAPDRIEQVLKGVRGQDAFTAAVLVHGNARGVDRHAAEAWERMGGTTFAMPARWSQCARDCPPNHLKRGGQGRQYCPTAGHRRNQRMVDGGAALCLAFSRDDSAGTNDCVRRAQEAGIPVLKFDYALAVDQGVWL